LKSAIRRQYWSQLLFVLLCLMPLVILFLLPSGELIGARLLFWLILMMCFLTLWAILVKGAKPAPAEEELKILGPNDSPEDSP
jgi:uncharacterized membrane protein YhaH (DUF805 family)